METFWVYVNRIGQEPDRTISDDVRTFSAALRDAMDAIWAESYDSLNEEVRIVSNLTGNTVWKAGPIDNKDGAR